jgi:hypothetical protein
MNDGKMMPDRKESGTETSNTREIPWGGTQPASRQANINKRDYGGMESSIQTGQVKKRRKLKDEKIAGLAESSMPASRLEQQKKREAYRKKYWRDVRKPRTKRELESKKVGDSRDHDERGRPNSTEFGKDLLDLESSTVDKREGVLTAVNRCVDEDPNKIDLDRSKTEPVGELASAPSKQSTTNEGVPSTDVSFGQKVKKLLRVLTRGIESDHVEKIDQNQQRI